jgi:hypothetical protein
MKTSAEYLSKGFFTMALNTPGAKTDYLKLAYLCALSIQKTQSIKKIAVGVEKKAEVPAKYRQLFDAVIEVPWGLQSAKENWKMSDEWKAIYMSPYELTLKIDSDMLFFDDLIDWWYVFSSTDFLPAAHVLDYRGEISPSLAYRPEVKEYELPLFYSALFYYRKSPPAFELFQYAELIFKEWPYFQAHYLPKYSNWSASTDVVFSLASYLLGYQYTNQYPYFTHMKAQIQQTQRTELKECWMQSLKYYFDSHLNLYIENFKQKAPFHYQEKSFCTDQLILKYEKYLGI